MGRARYRNARSLEQLATNPLRQIASVLHRIVQGQFSQTMKGLARREFREIQGQSGFRVDRSKTASGAFEMNSNVSIDMVTVAHRRARDGAVLLIFAIPLAAAEQRHAFVGDLNINS